MDLSRGSMCAVQHFLDHPRRLAWDLIRAYGNESVSTECNEGQGRSVVTGEHAEVLRSIAHDLHHLRKITRRLFCRDDIVELFRKLECRLRGNVRRGPARDVVKHDRK